MASNDNIMVKISPVRVDDNILAFGVIEETKGFADRIHQLQTQYVIKKQELIEDFCMQMGYSYPSEDTIVKNNHIYFRIANETVIVYGLLGFERNLCIG